MPGIGVLIEQPVLHIRMRGTVTGIGELVLVLWLSSKSIPGHCFDLRARSLGIDNGIEMQLVIQVLEVYIQFSQFLIDLYNEITECGLQFLLCGSGSVRV